MKTRKVLIVIDMQNSFINKYTFPLIDKIKFHIKQNADFYDFIIFTSFKNKTKSNFTKRLQWFDMIKKMYHVTLFQNLKTAAFQA